jgi:amino acid transporter
MAGETAIDEVDMPAESVFAINEYTYNLPWEITMRENKTLSCLATYNDYFIFISILVFILLLYFAFFFSNHKDVGGMEYYFSIIGAIAVFVLILFMYNIGSCISNQLKSNNHAPPPMPGDTPIMTYSGRALNNLIGYAKLLFMLMFLMIIVSILLIWLVYSAHKINNPSSNTASKSSGRRY